MCYLVSWLQLPKSDAQLMATQTEEFVPDERDPIDAYELAKNKVAKLFTEGAKDIKIWKLVATPATESVIMWNES
jgi:hypothetical protein